VFIFTINLNSVLGNRSKGEQGFYVTAREMRKYESWVSRSSTSRFSSS